MTVPGDGFDASPHGGSDRRRSGRFRPGSVRLKVAAQGLLGWVISRERPLLDCSRFGLAYEETDPPEVGDWLVFSITTDDWTIRRVPGLVRSVDRLVRDYRVGVEFVPKALGGRRGTRLARELSRLDAGPRV